LVARAEGSLAIVGFVSAVVLAAWAFVSWTIIKDMSKKMTYSARIVVVLGARAIRGVEVSLLIIPEREVFPVPHIFQLESTWSPVESNFLNSF